MFLVTRLLIRPVLPTAITFDPANLINIVLAAVALSLYVVGSRRFYLDRRFFLAFLVSAILVDSLTAVLASFGITPTTELPHCDFVPWGSVLFVTHVILAMIGFIGFLAVTITLLIRGTRRPYPRMRVWQYKALLPVWVVGEGIALTNALMKVFFHIRLYDYL
jgi:Na+/phosphate symporter